MRKTDIKTELNYDNQLTAILGEYNMLREEMRMFLDYHRRDTQIFIGIIGVLISVYLTDSALLDVQVLTLIVPSTIFLYYVMQIFNLHMVSAQAKACARIEHRVNNLLGSTAMDWESVVARKVIRGAVSPTPLATGSMLLFFICIFIAFVVRANENYGVLSLLAHGVELVVMLVVTGWWALFETRSKFLE